MAPIPANCPKCGSPTKNEICPSCGWNPAAPDPGITEAQSADAAKAAELRRLMGLPAAAPKPEPKPAALAVGDPGDDALRGYLLGMGYQSAAIPDLLAKNRAGVIESFNKAHQQTAAIVGDPSLPQNSAPPTNSGW